jgi:hypothetical protein
VSAGQARGQAAEQIAARKRVRAMQLRSLGWSYEAIASALLPCDEHKPDGRHGCLACVRMYAHRASAKRAVDRILADEYDAASDTREAMRRHQLAQIDLLLRRVMPEAMGSGDGHLEAQRNAVRLLDRRARLLGLDAPTRVAVTTELDMQISQLYDELVGNGSTLDDELARLSEQGAGGA